MPLKYEMNISVFNKIPGYPFAYWVGTHFGELYENSLIENIAEVITGMTIGDNNKYLRLWYETNYPNLALGKESMSDIDLNKQKWIPYSKGGERIRWYGGYDYVVNWKEKDKFNRSKTTLQHLYLKEALTWPFITSTNLTVKILPKGFLWDVAGSPCFFNDKSDEMYVLGFLNSSVSDYILNIINPTINVQANDIARLPIIESPIKKTVVEFVLKNIEESQVDWDSKEVSWNFRKHPLV